MHIGVDLGGTNIAVGIVDEHGNIIYEMSCPTKPERTYEEIIDDIGDLILMLIGNFHVDRKKIRAIGVGIPGLSDKEGNVISCVNLGWTNIPLKSILEYKFNIPVYIDNDATVAAVAEYEKGQMKGCESCVMFTLGTGIGGGIILNGKVHRGFNSRGSELGHMIVGKNSYDCNCGRNGCLETFASATAIIRYTKKLLEKTNEETLITGKIEGNINNLNAEIIFDCAKARDKIALIGVQRLVKYLSIGIDNIVNIIDPEIVVLGGGISGAGQYLLDMLIEEMRKNRFYKDSPLPKIVLAKLGNRAGIIGAAMLGKYE